MWMLVFKNIMGPLFFIAFVYHLRNFHIKTSKNYPHFPLKKTPAPYVVNNVVSSFINYETDSS